MESVWRKQTKNINVKKEQMSGKTGVLPDISCFQGKGLLNVQSGYSKAGSNSWDVIVVGAGMAGLLTAYYLKREGLNVLVLEAKTVASGQTERTTAKITSQHDLKYSKLIKTVGLRKAWMYAGANEDAIREYERLIREEEIECDFERVSSYLYTTQSEKQQTVRGNDEKSRHRLKTVNNVELLKKEEEAAKQLGIDASFTRETELPFKVTGALCFKNQAQFSPLKFIDAIVSKMLNEEDYKEREPEAKGKKNAKNVGEKSNKKKGEGTVEILEHTKVLDIKGHKVTTGKAVFTADKIIVATHYPLLNLPGFYFLRQHQERSYVLALTGCKRFEGMYYGIDKSGLSFRQAGEHLLLGGGGHRTGENGQGGAYDLLAETAHRYFPKCTEVTRWSAQDCMPHDGIPFIGKYSVFTPHLYVATGFQKWGMSSSMIAAMILRDELCGIENPYKKLFTPQRMNFRAGFPNLIHDVGMSVKGLWNGAFDFPRDAASSLPNGHGGIVSIHRKRYACYRDEKGELHKISARCPHMGCELTWNPDEKSWDCPCHGSRFDVDGNLLDNPAKVDSCKSKLPDE